MLIEKVTTTSAELNAETNKVIPLTKVTLEQGYGDHVQYRPFRFLGKNVTGATVYVLPLGAEEYTAWVAASSISAFLEFANNADILIPVTRDEITKLVVHGTTGSSHTANLDIFSIRENTR